MKLPIQCIFGACLLLACLCLPQTARAQSALLSKVRAGDDVKIVMIGTSLTDGGSWPGSLQTWLRGESPGPGIVNVVNLAVGGTASTEGVSSQTPTALTHNPDAVFIEFSMNDAATVKNVTKQQAEDNLNWMIDQFVAQNPNVIIVLQTMNCLPPDTSPFSPRVDLNGYYQIYRDVAVERGAILVDHYPNWLDVYNNDFALWQTYMRDVVHPNATGEANVLMPELQRVLLTAPDGTPPTLTGMVDDRSGGPVATNTIVTYTVTFSEDMNVASVESSDFSNAGSAAITIGAVSEVSQDVYTIEVTPTSLGDLQLQINAGAVLTDPAGNALVTTTAILDDTTITVSGSNASPTWLTNPVNESGATQDSAYASTLANDADDTDGDVLSFAKVAGPDWLVIAPDGTLSGTPGNDDVGANGFTVSVSDSLAAPVQATLNINVANVNDPPVFTVDPFSAADATLDAAYSSSIAGAASDSDGDELTFSMVSGPSWLGIASNGTLSGTPTNGDLGGNSFTVSVSDGIAAPVEGTLQISVLAAAAPLIASWDAWADITTPYDADAVASGFSATAATNTNRVLSTFTSNDGTFGGVGGADSTNTAGLLLRESDNKTVTFTLTNNTGLAYSIESLHFDYNRRGDTTPNEIVIGYVSGGLGPASTTIATEGSIAWDGYASGAADFPDYDYTLATALTDTVLGVGESAVFTLTFNGGSGNSSGVLDNISFRGSPAGATGNTPPNWLSNPVNEIGATQGSPYVSSLSDDAEDADEDDLTFNKSSGPDWLSVSSVGGLSGTPGSGDVGGNVFTVSVSDGIATVQVTLNINVANVNDPPVFTVDPFSAADATVDINYSATIAGSASDSDGDDLTFSKVGGPTWLSVSPTGALSGTPSSGDLGENSFTVSVSDGLAASVEATLKINVSSAPPPPPSTGDILASWDAWADSSTPYTSDAAVTGFTATAATNTNRVLSTFTSNDGTFGTVSGANTANTTGVLVRDSDNKVLTLTLTNNSGSAYSIDSLHFDYERRANSPNEIVLTYVSGGLGLAGTLNTWSGIALGSYSSGASDFTDYDFTLGSALADTELADGESAVFTLTFNGGSGTSSGVVDNVAFRGSPAVVNDYDAWSASYPGLGLPDNDDDMDGVSNETERMFGLNPLDSTSVTPYVSGIKPSDGTFSYTRRTQSLTGLTYKIWYSTNLSEWFWDSGATESPGTPVGDVETVAVSISPALLAESKLFIKLSAEDLGPATGN